MAAASAVEEGSTRRASFEDQAASSVFFVGRDMSATQRSPSTKRKASRLSSAGRRTRFQELLQLLEQEHDNQVRASSAQSILSRAMTMRGLADDTKPFRVAGLDSARSRERLGDESSDEEHGRSVKSTVSVPASLQPRTGVRRSDLSEVVTKEDLDQIDTICCSNVERLSEKSAEKVVPAKWCADAFTHWTEENGIERAPSHRSRSVPIAKQAVQRRLLADREVDADFDAPCDAPSPQEVIETYADQSDCIVDGVSEHVNCENFGESEADLADAQGAGNTGLMDNEWAFPAKLDWASMPEAMTTMVNAMPTQTDLSPLQSVELKKGRLYMSPHLKKTLSTLTVTRPSCFYSRPTSPFRVMWCLIAVMFLFIDIIALPLMFFDPPDSAFMSALRMFTMFFWIMDIPVSFTTGYFDKNGHLEMRPVRIAQHYVRSWFVVDMCIVLVDWTVFFIEKGTKGIQDISSLSRSMRLVRFLSVIRLLRLAKLSTFMDTFQDLFASGSVTVHMNILKILIFVLTINHFIACCWYGMGNIGMEKNWIEEVDLHGANLGDKYVASYYWSLGQFGIGQVDYGPVNTGERMFGIAVLLFALVTFSSLVSSITNAMSAIRGMKSAQTMQFAMVRKYLKQNQIGRDLSQRILKHVEYTRAERKRRLQEDDVELFKFLSEPLRNELQSEIHVPHFQNHVLLTRLMKSVPTTMHKVCGEALRTLRLGAEDQLFANGEGAKFVYILLLDRGEQVEEQKAVYSTSATKGSTKSSRMNSTVKDQKLIAEATFWTNWVHCGDLVAVHRCEFLAIDPELFAKHIRSNTAAFFFSQSYCRQFLEVLNTIAEQCDEALSDLDQDYVYHQRYSSRISLKDEDASFDLAGDDGLLKGQGRIGRCWALLRRVCSS